MPPMVETNAVVAMRTVYYNARTSYEQGVTEDRMKRETDVVIAGAGPTGLTLAIELARRGVPVRVVDEAPRPFPGSRGKGLQPRTLEVFDDLGVIDDVLAAGAAYPRFRVHIGPLAWSADGMSKVRAATPAVPYPNLWMVPQFRTDEILSARLASLGVDVERGTSVAAFSQDERGVVTTLVRDGVEERAASRFLVGCDGGHSAVREGLPVRFEGAAIEGERVVVADVQVTGLDDASWHVWPLAKGCVLTLCPLPGTNLHQLAAPLSKKAAAPSLDLDGMRAFVAAGTGGRVRVERAPWVSLFRPQVRMVDRARVGRVFLAGDAAHVHPPSGGQGLNTGVQDAYNLGWKIAACLDGAPDALLDTYEAERLPIAAAVLGLSKKLYKSTKVKRGPETQQLDLHYRWSALSRETRSALGAVRAGDRAPDGAVVDAAGNATRLFDLYRGPHMTLLVGADVDVDRVPAGVGHVVRVRPPGTSPAGASDVIDAHGHVRAAYGIGPHDVVLVRPDGYVGLFGSFADVESYAALV